MQDPVAHSAADALRPPASASKAAHPAATPRAAETVVSLGSNAESGLSASEAHTRLLRDGANEVPEKKDHPLRRFAGKFWGLSAWMIELIALVSFILHKAVDVWIAIALLVVNAILSFLQEQHASTAVAALRGRLRVSARVLRDGSWSRIEARELVPGDIVRARSGDFVPADLQVIAGTLQIDQSALTGESETVERTPGTSVYSGSIVQHGEATAVVLATGVRTYFGRTTQLVESAHPKLHIEEVISHVVRWLFLIVGILVSLTLVASLIEGAPIADVLPLSLVLLMSAVPVALPVMFTVSMAVGSVELARQGVLVTHLSAAEDAANMDVVCADKTGTLTMNRLSFVRAIAQPGFVERDVIVDGALASNDADQDPIDLAFLRAAREQEAPASGKIISFLPFSPKTRSTEAVIAGPDGQFRVLKGALRTVALRCGADSAKVAALEAAADEEARKGYRIIAVARARNTEPLQLVGMALLSDTLRPDSRQLIEELRSLGVSVRMLTGDALPVARQVAAELGLGEIVRAPAPLADPGQAGTRSIELPADAGGLAEVFPEEKLRVVTGLQRSGHVVGMTGDGVNDAPALRQAEVGIAVSGATDVAKGAASAVLTDEGLRGIVQLVKNGRAIYQRVLTWIVNKISRTILKAGFVVLAFLGTGRFVISALGMVLLVFMTDFVKISLSTDRVRPSQRPETWNIGPQVKLAVLMGLLMLAEGLMLLAFAWNRFDLAGRAGELQTFVFQQLLFLALFSILSIRERRWFWSSRPSLVLALALGADALAGWLIGWRGLAELRPLPLSETALIVACAAASCLGVNDLVKWAWYRQGERDPNQATRAPAA